MDNKGGEGEQQVGPDIQLALLGIPFSKWLEQQGVEDINPENRQYLISLFGAGFIIGVIDGDLSTSEGIETMSPEGLDFRSLQAGYDFGIGSKL